MIEDRHLGYLEHLGHELDARGLACRVVRSRSGTVFLRVVNPVAAGLSENVTCAPESVDRLAWFWWSWGEPMHGVDDPGGAAAKVARVLDTQPG